MSELSGISMVADAAEHFPTQRRRTCNALGFWRSAAGYVDRILKSNKPADMPVQQPTHFRFFVNLRAAKTLGIVIAESVLALADEVIE